MVLQALYSGFAQHVAPSSGVSPHSRPLGTVSADRQGGLLHGLARPCAQDLRSRSRRRSMCCRARRLGRWRSRRRWCWRCRAGLLGPRIELAAHGALDDAEQVPGGVADAMLAAPCGPLVQHSLPQGSVHLLQRHPGAGLLFRLQFRETLGPLQVAQRARLRGSTYFINTTTTYCFGFRRAPSGAGFGPASDSEEGRSPFRRRLAGPSSESWIASSCG